MKEWDRVIEEDVKMKKDVWWEEGRKEEKREEKVGRGWNGI